MVNVKKIAKTTAEANVNVKKKKRKRKRKRKNQRNPVILEILGLFIKKGGNHEEK